MSNGGAKPWLEVPPVERFELKAASERRLVARVVCRDCELQIVEATSDDRAVIVAWVLDVVRRTEPNDVAAGDQAFFFWR